MRRILWGAAMLAGASLLAGHGHGQTSVPTVHEAMKDVVAVQAAILWDASNNALDDDGNPAASKMTQAKWNQVTEAAARMRTAAMMLEHIGEAPAAARLMTAVEQVCADGVLTADLGGTARTADVTAAVVKAIRGAND